MAKQGLHGAKEALLTGSQQVLHALLHVMVARVKDGLQEGQHLPHNLIIGVGQQRDHLQRTMGKLLNYCCEIAQALLAYSGHNIAKALDGILHRVQPSCTSPRREGRERESQPCVRAGLHCNTHFRKATGLSSLSSGSISMTSLWMMALRI